jgi:energy-coupling factor transporter ATP-binding protein EcfA2
MALLDEVVSWAKLRPWWQQRLLLRLARGEAISDDDCVATAAKMVEPLPPTPPGGWLAELKVVDRSASEQVRLVAVRDVENVNRLAPGQRLTFAPEGLTVVFGRNGSGKSGYARVIQAMVRTRKRSTILSDVFGPTDCRTKAVVEYTVGEWAGEAALGVSAPVDLSRVSFYDEKCGDDYLVTEAEPAFSPSALRLLDDLAHACQRIREVLLVKLRALDPPAVGLPQLEKGTPAASWLSSLSGATTDVEIATNCLDNPEDATILAELDRAAGILRALDPTVEKNRLQGNASALARLSSHLDALDRELGKDREDVLNDLRSTAVSLRQASELASSAGFSREPVPGVGGETWRALWHAAVAFSRVMAPGSDTHPPSKPGDRCVLCQQELDTDAASRMDRFHSFVEDTTSTQAAQAEQNLSGELRRIESVTVTPGQVSLDLGHIAGAHPDLRRRCIDALAAWESRKASLVGAADVLVPVAAEGSLVAHVRSVADDEANQAAMLNAETVAAQLAANATLQSAARARIALAAARDAVVAERDRLRQRAQIEAARTEAATKGITDKIGELTRRHVTVAMQDQFSRESDRLDVTRVTLRDTKARLGTLLHRPEFIGATLNARLPEVLSEGEQTALGLAGFLTEARFDESKSALVFDDPVTSLDHVRRDKVAKRIAGLAAARQVIVFTHDVTFTVDLRRACEDRGVHFTERAILLGPHRQPGHTQDKLPWTAQDAAQRLNTLDQRLAAVKREAEEWDEEEYGRRARELAGEMSETWERVISQEIANRLVRPDTNYVQPMMMRVLRQITEQDDKEFQSSYSRISAWAPRHDNAAALNYVPPSLGELETEIGLMRAWFKRVRGYAS